MSPLRQPKADEQAQPGGLLGTRPLRPPAAANDNRRPARAVARLACAWALVALAAALALAVWLAP